MLAWLKAQFRPAGMAPDQIEQRKRLLSTILWMQLGMAGLIGLVNIQLGAIPKGIMLMATASAAIPSILLNRRGHYIPAAALTAVMMLTAIDFILYTAGGIHDRVIVAFPIFVMLGTLLFARRSLPFFAMAALGSVIAIGWIEMFRETGAGAAQTLQDIILICLMTVGAGLIVWVAVGGLEENLRLARESEKRLREAYDRTLEGWSRALGYRDYETQGHARRVVKLCMRLAGEWGFGEDSLAHIYRGALLHDIGKMAIPDRILLKPGPLNDSEWKVMKQHPAVARELLRKIPYLRPALSIPAFHHERWDGSGYPRGISGSRIPLEARIFAVVDQYDALTSDRPYRKACSRRKAVDYIKANAGRIFDPDVCTVFVRLWEARAFGTSG